MKLSELITHLQKIKRSVKGDPEVYHRDDEWGDCSFSTADIKIVTTAYPSDAPLGVIIL